MTDLTPICSALIALAAALITAFLIPCIKRKTTAQDREAMLAWVEIAVAAAQQLLHDKAGQERKDYVLDILTEKGYNINELDLDSAIEAAVLKLHRQLEAA